MNKVFIIAEAGVNHNGSLKIAKKLIDKAKAFGADAVKFQTFKTEDIMIRSAPKAEYHKRRTRASQSQHAMLKKLELDAVSHKKLMDYCRRKKIMFLSSPYDFKSIDLLNSLGLRIFKIPSAEITDIPYLKKIGRLRKKILLSTGMTGLKEVKDVLGLLTEAGTARKNITVLHCNTEYPTPMRDVNLRAMLTIKNSLGVSVGYSDHTSGIEVPAAAVALGATVIEKHFTLDKNMEGPDHAASLEPEEFKLMVSSIRNIEKALGDGKKRPTPSEIKNKLILSKSIVAVKSIAKGELFTEDNITAKRPASGLSPKYFYKLIGKKASRDIESDEVLIKKAVRWK